MRRIVALPGTPPAHADVVVICDVDADVVDDVARDTQHHRQVKIRRVTPAAWMAEQAAPLVQQVVLSPRVDLIEVPPKPRRHQL